MGPPELSGRKALVIGAGTPLGRATALALADAGADVALAATSLDGDEVMAVRRTRRAILALGRRSAEYVFDTTLGQNVLVSTRQVSKEMGGIDLLVNAQDAFFSAPIEKTTDAEWGRVLALNLSGVFFACRACLREMAAQGGSIVNFVPNLPLSIPSQVSAYAAARQGVIGLTRALAGEFADRRIRINAIEVAGPGSVGDDTPADLEPATISAAAAMALFLASDEAAALTGQILQAGDPGS